MVDERVRAKDLQKYLLFCKQVEGGGGGGGGGGRGVGL